MKTPTDAERHNVRSTRQANPRGSSNDSVEKAALGSDLVNEAGTHMQGVVASVQRMTDLMSEITHASAERSSGIERVTHTIHDMDKSTQLRGAKG